MLSLSGDDPALIPDVPPPSPTPRRQAYRFSNSSNNRGNNLSARIAGYMARLPNLSEGQGRDDVAYSFACWLVRDLDLADAVALDWLRRWDASNNPPKGEERLNEILKSAHTSGQHSVGCGLAPDSPRHSRRRTRRQAKPFTS